MTDNQLIALAELQRDKVGALAFRQGNHEFVENMSLQISRASSPMGDAGDDDCLTPEEAAMNAFGVVAGYGHTQTVESDELDALYDRG
jgi:hypothetical protein